MLDQDGPSRDDGDSVGGPTGSPTTDESVVGLPDDDSRGSTTIASTGILAQLQQLIAQVAAAPVTREVAAKTAELAAMAAEKAGPAARSLAARTDEVGQSVAERALTFASSMRGGEHVDAEPPEPTPVGRGSGT